MPDATDTSHSPWKIRDFRTLFAATALSTLADNVGYLAIPVIAVVTLDAGPGQVGLLAMLATLAFLLIGLPAGAWVDRMRHRRILIAADTTRGLLITSIPVAWACDALTFPHLCVVAFLNGCATVFFDVGTQSSLPNIVGRGTALVQANSGIVSLQAFGSIAGRGVGGGLVQLLTAPVAVAATGLLYLGSALRLTPLPREARPVVEASEARTLLRRQIAEGLRHVLGHAELRALVLSATLLNLGAAILNTLLPLLITRELGLSSAALGAYWAAGGVGVLVGARSAHRLAARFGPGRVLGLLGVVVLPAALLVPMATWGASWLWLAGCGWALVAAKIGVNNVLGVTLRQSLTPPELLGRMNATFRFLLTGALAIGAALAGAVGEWAGVHAALWLGGGLLASSFLPMLLSPLRRRGAISGWEASAGG